MIWTLKKMNANWNGRHFEQYFWENTEKKDDGQKEKIKRLNGTKMSS